MAVSSSKFRFDEEARSEDPFSQDMAERLVAGIHPEIEAGSETRRLWRPLSYRPARPREVKDFDLIGERTIGFVKRSARSRARIRGHAARVIAMSDSFRAFGERAFDEEVEKARSAVRRGRRDFETRTHAFAVVREAIRRTIGLSLYEEQVMGGWVMEDGCIAEMATGEGKTITACLTAAVHGWNGFGVHVVTVNDYLARRDAEINHKVYRRLGLSVGIIQEACEDAERREAYLCDVTYMSDKQVIFDFLRDRLRSPLQPRLTSLLLEELTNTGIFEASEKMWTKDLVLRGLAVAIVDEADSVLIDEASTPAIIGAPGGKDSSGEYYVEAQRIAELLEEGVDFEIDQSQHRVDITDAGLDRLEELAHRLPPFWAGPRRREELVVQALTARHLFTKDDHYIIRNDDVQIVDPGTGRVLEGRQWQLGLHQSVQAKENLEITRPHETIARISYQRFFQMYDRLAGMTGTAWEVRTELWRNYHLPVVRIPTHRPMIRRHLRDRVYLDRDSKFKAVADHIEKLHKRGQPVLVGSRSVEASEELSGLLEERRIAHRVLNAVRHEQEAAIVACAGDLGAVTVATNMAGRGTDISLARGVKEAGGLFVLATERHDSYRIDRQLYGRSGRQGDPGVAQAFVSLDDPLIEAAGIKWMVRLIRRFPVLAHSPLVNVLWTHAQKQASKRKAMSREMASTHDLWFDRAIHFENR